MSFKEHNRLYDLVVFGATGYTGRVVAEYITANFPINTKWAVAGRSGLKLQAIVDNCKTVDSDRSPPEIEIVNVDNNEEMSALAKKTFVVITTVGPYSQYGEQAVKACVEAGTHYLDATGEAPWVYKMIKKYEHAAKESGAILIPQMGLESAPPDLCTWSLANKLRKELNAQTKDVVLSLHVFRAAPSGGTISTVLSVFDNLTLNELMESGKPFAHSPVPHPAEPKRRQTSIWQKIFGIHTVPNLGTLTTGLTGTTDQGVIERSWGLLSEVPSRKDQFYGPNFHWEEYSKPRNWLEGILTHWLLTVAVLFLAMAPIRAVARKFAPEPGTGPSKEDMDKEEVEWRGIANPDTELPANKQAFVRAWYHGSMYKLTAMLCSEGARILLEDDLDLDGGFYTPCCLGQRIIDRAHEGGLKIETRIQHK
ncbi:hypothetical protein TRIATDRAFT_237331 [Trichoderma atroviride IMI 206040]|uniref:Saccharopine dehydrogenase NADP binding domain-containing protein n=1 Tax=Hypocrea atroviridis (strain ATCC 20476 / IMI 206040) TaxID=452589 RepID=G9NM40_HYPAI|nr:uncharacterized protein TRIATDRAFT_237331 [Trichoderma atroviride IMI 206040]EHK47972.1 hypothetical protein TRIATDRAFT_237331 [Trichoderma atroviride IMI 206040]